MSTALATRLDFDDLRPATRHDVALLRQELAHEVRLLKLDIDHRIDGLHNELTHAAAMQRECVLALSGALVFSSFCVLLAFLTV